MSDLLTDPPGPALSRRAVVSLGVCALLIGFVIAPVFPFVVVAVMIWWLSDDLRRDPSTRPGWLGTAAFVIFTAAAAFIVLVITVFAVDESCGRKLFDPAADAASFDQACADAQRWRSIVGVTLALAIGAMGYVGVRRSDSSQSPLAIAARTFVVMAAAIAGVTTILVVT